MDFAEIVAWLLSGDPAIAWQTERDLLRLPAPRYKRTRKKIAKTGWGAKLLERRSIEGTWGGGLYTPKWTSTFYTLQLLGLLGVGDEEQACVESCRLLLDRGVEKDGVVRLLKSAPPDTCVTGMLLTMSITFGLRDDARARSMVEWLLDQQMHDGGWNCRWRQGRHTATHGSFHTTMTVLEALHAWLVDGPPSERRVALAAEAGREFMLTHHLYRSHRTGKIARHAFTQLCFPFWWKFDVLRGLDYFRATRAWDPRLNDALRLVECRRGKDGRWILPRPHPGRVWFNLESKGKPSRWNTLRALRVLDWAAQVDPELPTGSRPTRKAPVTAPLPRR